MKIGKLFQIIPSLRTRNNRRRIAKRNRKSTLQHFYHGFGIFETSYKFSIRMWEYTFTFLKLEPLWREL